MQQTLVISDTLYKRLSDAARARGLSSIEQLLEMWQPDEDDLHRRRETVRRIDLLRERLFANYGEMIDSVDLIRADRER